MPGLRRNGHQDQDRGVDRAPDPLLPEMSAVSTAEVTASDGADLLHAVPDRLRARGEQWLPDQTALSSGLSPLGRLRSSRAIDPFCRRRGRSRLLFSVTDAPATERPRSQLTDDRSKPRNTKTERGAWGRPGGHFAHGLRLDPAEAARSSANWPKRACMANSTSGSGATRNPASAALPTPSSFLRKRSRFRPTSQPPPDWQAAGTPVDSPSL